MGRDSVPAFSEGPAALIAACGSGYRINGYNFTFIHFL